MSDSVSIPSQFQGHTRATSAVNLLSLLPTAQQALAWVNQGDGLVACGEAARFEPSGADRFGKAEQWWLDCIASIDSTDEVQLPGTGPVAFVSMAFADDPGDSVLVLPKITVGQRAVNAWITTIDVDHNGAENPLGPVQPISQPVMIHYSDGEFPVDRYRKAACTAIARMQAGELAKVVLAHDLLATVDTPVDPRFLLAGLTKKYPSCWTFAIDGLVGATPELLLKRQGLSVFSRVLAGTIWPHSGANTDELSSELLRSKKDLDEHAFAVDSLAEALRPFCAALSVSPRPQVIHLPNVLHLATKITGKLAYPVSLLRLAEALHPTAAVGGTPRAKALKTIAELEGMDRGRYAGPVGWIDADGNGELGIALRCGQVTGNAVRMFAGSGLVSASNPDVEAAEIAAKMAPIRDALERLA